VLLAAHRVWFWVHGTQAAGGPLLQTGVAPEQVACVDHAPCTHCWTAFPRHLVSVGAQTPPHVPVIMMHDMWGPQLVVFPHIPVLSQVCIAVLPTHSVAGGVHFPVHSAPPPSTSVHTPVGQSVDIPQLPLVSQFCTALPLHRVLVGPQAPLHIPLRHVRFEQGMAVPQAPPSSHVSTALFTHWTSIGLHIAHPTPPSRHTGEGAAHVVCVAQLPVPSQVWMALPRQRAWPGPHTPPHCPLMQVWSGGQGVPGRRHCTHVLVDGSHTPPSGHDAGQEGASASGPITVVVVVVVVVVVPPPVPPVPKPP
jgi:hypothetical protein